MLFFNAYFENHFRKTSVGYFFEPQIEHLNPYILTFYMKEGGREGREMVGAEKEEGD